MSDKEKQIGQLFNKFMGDEAQSIVKLPQSGSYREYYRISSGGQTVIAVCNADKKENRAFVSFSRSFRDKGLHVPEIFLVDEEKGIYLQEDLGNTTLFDLLQEKREGHSYPKEVLDVYKKAVQELPRFQVWAAAGLDYSLCYPRAAFDRQSMSWDLNYFKYYFLKLAKIPFDEQALENDFNTFIDYLLTAEQDAFLYRDFQSRNIMVRDGEPWFIDYQGGRKGAVHYDLASLLFDAKANMPAQTREELLETYITALNKYAPEKARCFRDHFYGYVLIRMLQAMGAYGFRGFYEKKEHFLLSIPFALRNLDWFLGHVDLPVELPELTAALKKMVFSKELKQYGRMQNNNGNNLCVRVFSFSYKRGVPEDETENGGGFVFDCRALKNPGRLEPYKLLTGKDKAVIDYLESESRVADYLSDCYALTDRSVERYLERGFSDLMVSFGCTGGQHRSVYCADRTAAHLRQKYGIDVRVRHIEQEIKMDGKNQKL